jgi:putative Mg2+ transporter-C (MgtC) family protein
VVEPAAALPPLLLQGVGMVEGFRPELIGKLLLGAILGGLIGLDREAGGKPAGLRTNMLICIGATLLADLSVRFVVFSRPGPMGGDPARLVAQVVSGIGFLGAGTILQSRGNVTGLTTAATLWVVAAIGIAVGSGHYISAVGATALVLITLIPLGMLEKHFQRRRGIRSIQLVVERGEGVEERIEEILESKGLRIESWAVERETDERVGLSVQVRGDEARFREARAELADRPEVRSIRLERGQQE